MTELERKLYLACHHAFLWMCGNWTEAAEKECMDILQEAIEAYRIESEPKCCWYDSKTGNGIGHSGPCKTEPKDSKTCPHVYESDGTEMIKDPTGKEWAIGGTAFKGRWTYDPWCGLETPRPKKVEEKSLQNKFRDYYTDNSCYMSRETANELVRLAEIHFTQNPKKFL